jgi:O-acetyl-ADP-ribose deacetylase (regulator of RNase III)
MITFTEGNLLKSKAEALVNTVNTVGVMGKGIALMFKEAFPDNFKQYEAAAKSKELRVGRMFVTERLNMLGPKWIINFPTKQHWRNPSKIEWIKSGLQDLRRVIVEKQIRSVAIPPLGSGNGGLDWPEVRSLVIEALESLKDVAVTVYEPTQHYQNVSKREGVENLTPARAMIADLVRAYWVLGFECSLLEVQKLAYLLERILGLLALPNPLDLKFEANRFGPFAPRLTHLLNGLDGSYLHCGKRLADAGPVDVIWFDDARLDKVSAYLSSEGKAFRPALDATITLIDGFQSPLGMELLATVDWLVCREGAAPTVADVKSKLANWPGGAGDRKLKLFDDRIIGLALDRLATLPQPRPIQPVGLMSRG